MERNLYISLNEWRSSCPGLGEGDPDGRHLLKQQSHLCGSNQNKLNKKLFGNLPYSEREGSHVDKIKDKRPIWPFNPFPFAFANKQPALYQLQGAAIDSHWCIGIIRFAHLLFGQTSVPPARCILSGTASIQLAMKGSIHTYEIAHRYILRYMYSFFCCKCARNLLQAN